MKNITEYAEIVKDKQHFESKEIETIDDFGKSIWIESKVVPLFDGEKRLSEVLIHSDITIKKELEKLAVTDGLTKLYNRRFFNEILTREIKRAQRDKTFLSFLMLDVDYFKQYNDSYGHSMGDDVLVKIAETMRSSIKRASDFAFRLGGEEFGVLFNKCNIVNSQKIAENIRKNIENLNIPHSNSKVSDRVTVSVGLLIVDFAEESVDEHGFYTMADDALYQAKEKGRNRVVVYENDEVEFF